MQLCFAAALVPSIAAQTFGPQRIISDLTPCASSVATGDIDGDGVIDVLSCSRTTNTNLLAKVAWYRGEGGGHFGAQIVLDAPFHDGWDVRCADIDGDLDVDVVVSSTASGLYWFENLGGEPSPQVDTSVA